MGGIGSGRRLQRGKRTTDSMLRLDVRRLQRNGVLHAGNVTSLRWKQGGREQATITLRSEVDHVQLSYRVQRGAGDEWQAIEYPVYLNWTALHYGGRRPWFSCPAPGCGRRVAVLYGGSFFVCRQCQQLVYTSQRETAARRAHRRIDKLRARLGWEPGFIHGPGPKPKGMHWRTFERLETQHLAELGIVQDDVERLMERIAAVDARYGHG